MKDYRVMIPNPIIFVKPNLSSSCLHGKKYLHGVVISEREWENERFGHMDLASVMKRIVMLRRKMRLWYERAEFINYCTNH